MIFKLIVFAIAIYIIYIFFFKKKSPANNQNNEYKNRENKSLISEEMVECKKCGTFISINEAYKKGDNFYCIDECKDIK